MSHVRTVVPALVATVTLTLGAAALAGGGAAATASAPPEAKAVAGSPVAGLLAGSYQADFGRLSVADKARISNRRSPAISGSARLGRTVTVSSGTWKPAKVALDYQWFAGSTKVRGADEASYSPDADVVGKSLSVRVTASKAGYRATTVTERAGTVTGGRLAATSDPVVRGDAKVGEKLKVTPGRWSAEGVSLDYSWLNGRTEVSTGKTYVVRRSDRGDSLRVEVTASKDGYKNGSATTAPTRSVRR